MINLHNAHLDKHNGHVLIGFRAVSVAGLQLVQSVNVTMDLRYECSP